jgi:hydrogenase maturation protease
VKTIRVIALGHELASDDGAALVAARRLADDPGVELVLAGRPGAGLLDLLDPSVPTLLLDVVRLGAAAGAVVELRLEDLPSATMDAKPLSSHGLGAAEAFRLGGALGRVLPVGIFLGIGGRRFEPGAELDPEVEQGIDDLVTAARAAIAALRDAGASVG